MRVNSDKDRYTGNTCKCFKPVKTILIFNERSEGKAVIYSGTETQGV